MQATRTSMSMSRSTVHTTDTFCMVSLRSGEYMRELQRTHAFYRNASHFYVLNQLISVEAACDRTATHVCRLYSTRSSARPTSAMTIVAAAQHCHRHDRRRPAVSVTTCPHWDKISTFIKATFVVRYTVEFCRATLRHPHLDAL